MILRFVTKLILLYLKDMIQQQMVTLIIDTDIDTDTDTDIDIDHRSNMDFILFG